MEKKKKHKQTTIAEKGDVYLCSNAPEAGIDPLRLSPNYSDNSDSKLNLTKQYVDRVRYVATQFNRQYPNLERDELLCVGYKGLLKAVDEFDPERSTSFEVHVKRSIKNAMQDYAKGQIRGYRRSANAPARTSDENDGVDAPAAIDRVSSGYHEPGLSNWLAGLCDEALSVLTNSERECLVLKLGLYGKKQHSKREIAIKLRTTIGRVDKILSAARAKLEQYAGIANHTLNHYY